MCCRQQGGKGAASRGLSDLGSQQQQARSHVRAAGASGEELGRARNGHGVEALCASPSQPSSPAAAGRRGLWSVDTAQTTGSRSYRGYGPAGPPRGQWACPPVGAAYGGCTAGRWGERDRRSELRFCARATSSENADRRPQRPRPSSYLSTGDCHRLFECSPRSNPRETDRKHQALTVYRATR